MPHDVLERHLYMKGASSCMHVLQGEQNGLQQQSCKHTLRVSSVTARCKQLCKHGFTRGGAGADLQQPLAIREGCISLVIS